MALVYFAPVLDVRLQPRQQSSRERPRPVFPTPLQVWESGEAYTVQLWAPGADRERFHIEATAQQLSISGEIQVHGPEGAELLYQEVEAQPFQRTLKLSKTIQPEKVSATYRDGILTLTLPKADAARVVKVQVGTSTPSEAVTVESQPA
ncbi:Hsp20/alpha crystallin family protein [Synechococcus sp. OH20]|uniref:Hsp20/alpha crystallin family protein n=1 Tax=Synechococcus sp. OH20 TaxID=139337 RepID=UPI0039C60AAE